MLSTCSLPQFPLIIRCVHNACIGLDFIRFWNKHESIRHENQRRTHRPGVVTVVTRGSEVDGCVKGRQLRCFVPMDPKV